MKFSHRCHSLLVMTALAQANPVFADDGCTDLNTIISSAKSGFDTIIAMEVDGDLYETEISLPGGNCGIDVGGASNQYYCTWRYAQANTMDASEKVKTLSLQAKACQPTWAGANIKGKSTPDGQTILMGMSLVDDVANPQTNMQIYAVHAPALSSLVVKLDVTALKN